MQSDRHECEVIALIDGKVETIIVRLNLYSPQRHSNDARK